MNVVELNINALGVATTALLGVEKTNMLSELYVLLDNAEKHGFADGVAHEHLTSEEYLAVAYSDGEQDGYGIGVQEGFADGVVNAEIYGEDMYDAGYEQGYEDARKDLGECPMVDQDFDADDRSYFWGE